MKGEYAVSQMYLNLIGLIGGKAREKLKDELKQRYCLNLVIEETVKLLLIKTVTKMVSR